MSSSEPNKPIDIQPRDKRIVGQEPLPPLIKHPPAAVTRQRRPAGKMRNLLKIFPGGRTLVALYLYLQDPDANPMHRLSIVLSMLYFIMPLDFIPDFFLLPFGFVDDMAVFMGLLKFIGSEHLAPYREQARRWLRGETMKEITGEDD